MSTHKLINYLCWLAVAGAGGYFLFVEHGEHLFPILPYLILLACPLLHLFMHGGHGSSHHHSEPGEAERQAYQKGFEEGQQSRQ